jgi:hypothetical protein
MPSLHRAALDQRGKRPPLLFERNLGWPRLNIPYLGIPRNGRRTFSRRAAAVGTQRTGKRLSLECSRPRQTGRLRRCSWLCCSLAQRTSLTSCQVREAAGRPVSARLRAHAAHGQHGSHQWGPNQPDRKPIPVPSWDDRRVEPRHWQAASNAASETTPKYFVAQAWHTPLFPWSKCSGSIDRRQFPHHG